jgi:FkbM family methyltransferase
MEPGSPSNVKKPFLANFLAFFLRHRARGSSRLTFLCARHLESLQAVPIQIADSAPLYVDLRDGLNHHLLAGDPWEVAPWEADEQAVMRQLVLPGDTALDIGANIGLHSVLLSKLVGAHGQLSTFEPNAELHLALSRTVSNLGNASLYPFALSNRCGEAAFFLPMNHQKASLANWTDEAIDGTPRVARCSLRRLDDLVQDGVVPRPDFIKCDVEGAERLVFALWHAQHGRPRHVAAREPGELVCLDTFYIGQLKGVGKVWQIRACDAANIVAVPESRTERVTKRHEGAIEVLDRPDAPIILFEANVYNARAFGFSIADLTFLLVYVDANMVHGWPLLSAPLERVLSVGQSMPPRRVGGSAASSHLSAPGWPTWVTCKTERVTSSTIFWRCSWRAART